MSDGQSGSPEEVLLAGALGGDRKAMAAFIYHYGDRIRRRYRSTLVPQARSVFDSRDVVAEIVAVADRCVSRGFCAEREEQLWKLIWTVGDRVVRRRNELASRPVRWHPAAAESPNPASAVEFAEEVERVAGEARSDVDRGMLLLRARGLTLKTISGLLEASPNAVRKRWQRLRRRTRSEGGRSRAKGEGQGPGVHRCG